MCWSSFPLNQRMGFLIRAWKGGRVKREKRGKGGRLYLSKVDWSHIDWMIAEVCSVWRSSSPVHDHHLLLCTNEWRRSPQSYAEQHCNISDTAQRVLREPHSLTCALAPFLRRGRPRMFWWLGCVVGDLRHKVSSLPTTKREGPERITSVQSSLGPGQPRPLHHLIASQCNSIP